MKGLLKKILSLFKKDHDHKRKQIMPREILGIDLRYAGESRR